VHSLPVQGGDPPRDVEHVHQRDPAQEQGHTSRDSRDDERDAAATGRRVDRQRAAVRHSIFVRRTGTY